MDSQGYLTKIGEFAQDVFGLVSAHELEKQRIKSTAASHPDSSAGGPTPTVIMQGGFPMREMLIGGAILGGVLITVALVATRKRR